MPVAAAAPEPTVKELATLFTDALDVELAADGICGMPDDGPDDSSDDEPVVVGPTHPTHPPPVAAASAASSSVAGLDSEASRIVRLRDAVGIYWNWTDAKLICTDAGFVLKPDGSISLAGAPVGSITITFEGKTLSAKCTSKHGGKCGMLVKISGQYERAYCWLVTWLIAGHAMSAVEHSCAKDQLKVQIRDLRKRKA